MNEDIIIPTGCNALDNLMQGGIRIVYLDKENRYRGLPYGIFGKPDIGKSLTSLQTSISAISQGFDILYIDTEINWDEDTLNYYSNFLCNRFNVSEEDFNNKFHYLSKTTIFDLAELFGIMLEIEEHGKQTQIRFSYPSDRQLKLADTKARKEGKEAKIPDKTTLNKSFYDKMPITNLIKRYDIKLIIIDSIAEPIKNAIPTNTQNFPQRANILQSVLGSILKLADTYGVAFLIVTHGSIAGQDEQYGATKYNIWGGSNLIFYIKRWFLIYDGLKEDREYYKEWLKERDCLIGSGKKAKIKEECKQKYQLRVFYRYRYPAQFPEYTRILIEKDYGIRDFE